MSATSLWPFFHRGEKQNLSHYTAFCKACVAHHKSILEKEELENGEELDAAEQLATEERIFKEGKPNNTIPLCTLFLISFEACVLSGKTRGEKSAFVAHILGGRGVPACPFATKDAKSQAQSIRDNLTTKPLTQGVTSAKRSVSEMSGGTVESEGSSKRQKSVVQGKLKAYNAFDMPFSSVEVAAIEAQTLRACISANLPFRAFENPEMLKLFGMLRKSAPGIIPSRKVLSNRLLTEAAEVVDKNIEAALQGRELGLS